MKTFLYITIIFLAVISCKEDSSLEMASAADLQGISGNWYLKEIQKGPTTQQFWDQVPSSQTDTLIFRSDGVILDPNGLPQCCSPNSLIVNGRLLEIRPSTNLAYNPLCERVNCYYCATWDIELSSNELIVTACNMPKLKYVR